MAARGRARPGRFCRVEQRDLRRAFCLEVDVSGGVAVFAHGDDVTAKRHSPNPHHAAFPHFSLAFLSRYVFCGHRGVGCLVLAVVVVVGWCRRRLPLLLSGGVVCCC